MTHDQAIRRMAAREGVSIGDSRRLVRAYLAEVSAALARGERVVIPGVGTIAPPGGGRTRARIRTASALRETMRAATDTRPCDPPPAC